MEGTLPKDMENKGVIKEILFTFQGIFVYTRRVVDQYK